LSHNNYFKDESSGIEEKKKVPMANRVKFFFKRSKWKILLSGVVSGALLYASLVPSLGYTGIVKADPSSAKIKVSGHPCYGYFLNGHINLSFNPLMYPISHLTGTGRVSEGFTGWSGSTYPYEQSPVSAAVRVEENVKTGTLFRHVVGNLPYIVFVGLAVTFGMAKFFEEMRGRFRKSKPKKVMLHPWFKKKTKN